MGLVHSLNPVAQGGTEKILLAPNPEPITTSAPALPLNTIPQGRGRIIRDENGAVIGVELPEEPEAPANSQKGKETETWGEAMDDSDEEAEKMISPEASNWVKIGKGTPKEEPVLSGLGINQKKTGREVVGGTLILELGGASSNHPVALEKLSVSGIKTQRHASMHEVAWLKELVAVHGTGELIPYML
jgi:nucleolar protein 16